jgi:hypothetical protein
MHHDAEAHCIPIWAAERDPRITRIGRFVRCTRIDELPQLINVLRGDMSIVLVRQTDAVGAIRDRAPFGTSRHIAAEWPLTPIIWKVSLSFRSG